MRRSSVGKEHNFHKLHRQGAFGPNPPPFLEEGTATPDARDNTLADVSELLHAFQKQRAEAGRASGEARKASSGIDKERVAKLVRGLKAAGKLDHQIVGILRLRLGLNPKTDRAYSERYIRRLVTDLGPR